MRPQTRRRFARSARSGIQTVDGRNFLVALRLYGAELAFYDQTWKPDDIVRVD
jgi:hypothetical protein